MHYLELPSGFKFQEMHGSTARNEMNILITPFRGKFMVLSKDSFPGARKFHFVNPKIIFNKDLQNVIYG